VAGASQRRVDPLPAQRPRRLQGPTHGAVLEIDQDLELWGVVRWKSLSEMFQQTLDSLETGRPVVTAIGREIRPETVRESDGTSTIVWT
jgi:hypothetical protein